MTTDYNVGYDDGFEDADVKWRVRIQKALEGDETERHPKTNMFWELEQIEKALAENHSAAENIMNIVSDVQYRLNELLGQEDPKKCEAKK